MGKAFLASLFVLCMNLLILIEVLPFRAAGCVITLLLAGVATTAAREVALREIGVVRDKALTQAVAFFIAIFLIYSCGAGLLLSKFLGRFEPFEIAFRSLFMLTFLTAWDLFREARKRAI